MPKSNSNYPRPVSSIDAKFIKIGSRSPATDASTPPVSTSPEVQKRSSADRSPANPPDKNTGDKKRRYSKPLIKQLEDGVKAGHINEPLTPQKVKHWVHKYNIRKGDGTRYKDSSIANLLHNSYIGKRNKTNRNSTWLDRRKNEDGIYEYWYPYLFSGHLDM